MLLADGVGEIELASVFDVHGGQSLAARTLALSADGGPVRSRHGLTFLPRADLASAAPRLDRLLVPGAGAPDIAPLPDGPAPERLHDLPGFAYDTALADPARTTDVATARWTAKALELPTDGLVLDGPAWPWLPSAVPVVLVLVDALVVAGTVRLLGGCGGGPRDRSRSARRADRSWSRWRAAWSRSTRSRPCCP